VQRARFFFAEKIAVFIMQSNTDLKIEKMYINIKNVE
jgi:hypothetical protein